MPKWPVTFAEMRTYGRLNVVLGDEDAFGTFIFRTTGFNSIRTLTARLQYFAAASGDLLACLPLELKLRGKSTAQSFGKPIYYVDLVVRTGLSLEEAITQAREVDARRKACGFDQSALDEAARLGFERGVFEDGDEDGASVVEEFFPAGDAGAGSGSGQGSGQGSEAGREAAPVSGVKPGLREKLDRKAVNGQGVTP
jgi:hypothetical protein